MPSHGANAEPRLDSDTGEQPLPAGERSIFVCFAWGTILLISDLPDIFWHSLSGHVPGWLFWGKAGVLGVLLAIYLSWKRIRPLWQFAAVMLVFYLAFLASTAVGDTSWWRSRFSAPPASFTIAYLGSYIRDAGVALAVIGVLWLIKRDRRRFFLAKGEVDAAIQPVRWLGIRPGESWRTFGWIFAIAAGLAVLVPTVAGLRLSPSVLLRAAPLLPAGLLFAAINAFTEEIYFRASLLSTLVTVVGRNHALWMNVAFFGLNHYLYGSPPGVIGSVMTGFLAWLLGKSILETKGLWWAWFMHFVPDVVIFASYAVLWVQR